MAIQRSLSRLAGLYTIIEQIRSVEVQAADAAVQQVIRSIAIAATSRTAQMVESREALATDRREAWQVAETTRETLERRMERLCAVRVEREAVLAKALELHRSSRLEMERMQRIFEKTLAQGLLIESRQVQLQSDDRFASRAAWLEERRKSDVT